jgi:archaellum component FlaC
VLRLENALERLVEARARTEAAVSPLAVTQVHLEERVEQLEERMERVENRLDRVEAALVRLAEAQARTEEQLARQGAQIVALTEAQRRTEEQLARTEEQLVRQGAQIVSLTEAQRRTEERIERLTEQVQALVSWQRGEAGRREGERYERDVVRRAPVLFHGGRGGAPDQPEVQRRLTAWLQAMPVEDILPATADPFLADLLWWKGDQVAIVEVAIQVNGEDVRRVVQRAETLRRGGVQAMAVVIGENWATLDTHERAQALGVDWKVGADLSPGFLAFRRLAAPDGEGRTGQKGQG